MIDVMISGIIGTLAIVIIGEWERANLGSEWRKFLYISKGCCRTYRNVLHRSLYWAMFNILVSPKDAVEHIVMLYLDPNFANLQYYVRWTWCPCARFGWVWCCKMSLVVIRTTAKALMACFPTIYTVYVYILWLHQSIGSLLLDTNALHSPTNILCTNDKLNRKCLFEVFIHQWDDKS